MEIGEVRGRADRQIVAGVPAGHPAVTQENHREEGKLGADHREPEVPLRERALVPAAGVQWEPVVDRREDREGDPAHDDVVEWATTW